MAKYYLLSILLCLLPPFYYFLFRRSVKSRLIRTSSINQKRFKSLMKGFRNFWWYESVNAECPLGIIYHINKLAVILYPSVLFLTLTLGWLRIAVPFVSVLYGCISVLTAGMSLFSSIETNIAAYGKPFVLLKKTLNNGYTSSILDFASAAFPLLAGYAHILTMLNVLSTL